MVGFSSNRHSLVFSGGIHLRFASISNTRIQSQHKARTCSTDAIGAIADNTARFTSFFNLIVVVGSPVEFPWWSGAGHFVANMVYYFGMHGILLQNEIWIATKWDSCKKKIIATK